MPLFSQVRVLKDQWWRPRDRQPSANPAIFSISRSPPSHDALEASSPPPGPEGGVRARRKLAQEILMKLTNERWTHTHTHTLGGIDGKYVWILFSQLGNGVVIFFVSALHLFVWKLASSYPKQTSLVMFLIPVASKVNHYYRLLVWKNGVNTCSLTGTT